VFGCRVDRGEKPVGVDGGRVGSSQFEFGEYVGEPNRAAVGAAGDEVGDFPRDAAGAAAHLAVANDGAAESVAKMEVGEVVQHGAIVDHGGVAFGARGPVDVVVDHDRAVDERGEHVDR
jgi:hypothetical protein